MEMHWPLMFFTLFLCLGGGIFGLQGVLVLLGKGARVQLALLITSVVCIALGGAASFLHLQHWERVFNGFGHLTSGITQEMIAIVVFVGAAVVYFAMLRKAGTDGLPKWCGIMALLACLLLVFTMAHSYNMAARPLWNTFLHWLFYEVNALFLGSFGLFLIAAIKADDEVLSFVKKLALAGLIAQLLITAVYLLYAYLITGSYSSFGYMFDPVHPTQALQDPAAALASIFSGSEALLFWLGVVVIGLAVPAAAVLVARKNRWESNGLAVLAGGGLAGALAGGICFRAILYILGFSVFMYF